MQFASSEKNRATTPPSASPNSLTKRNHNTVAETINRRSQNSQLCERCIENTPRCAETVADLIKSVSRTVGEWRARSKNVRPAEAIIEKISPRRIGRA